MTTTEGSRLEPEQQPAEMGAEDPFDTAKPSRPGFVTWLAILEVLGGVFAVVVLLLGRQGVFGAVSDPLQFSQQHVVFTLFYAAVHVAAGIGMWLGRPWGWWLAAFSFLYSLVNNVSSLLLLPDMVGSSGEPDIRAGSYVIRELFDIGWDLIVLAYWFREGVRDYFGLLDFSRLKAIAGLVAVTILVFAAGYLLVGSASRDLDRIARLYEEGDLDTALEELELYLESHPEDDMAWTIMGHASQDAGLFEDAEAAYDRAIAINPERHEAWTGLGILNRVLGDNDRALECYEAALEIEPDDADTHSSLAVLALRMYEDEKALSHAETARALDRRSPVVAANLAVVYHYNGMYDERDEMTAEAERLGYEDVDLLQMIYEGLWEIRE